MFTRDRRVLVRILFGTMWILLASCSSRDGSSDNVGPTYDPFLPMPGATPWDQDGASGLSLSRPSGPTPTRAPLIVTVPPRLKGAPLVTPTPDDARVLPAPRAEAEEYVAQAGDTLASIAESFGMSVEQLSEANGIALEDLLPVGTTLKVPPPEAGTPGPSFKIIPDSELVYGPASAEFDIRVFVEAKGGYLAAYTEDVGTKVLTGTDVVERVAQDYSVSPRLLLAVIEHLSQWVTNSEPPSAASDYPLGFAVPGREGLYHQLTWAANELNRGFYLWRANAIGTWVLRDGSVVPIDPTINAGTAGVENLFAALDDRASWDRDVTAFGFFQTYFFLFGNPFDLAIEPLVPEAITQPPMSLPFERGSMWAFTGGPHAAWDSGSAWAALDFAASDVSGCAVSQQWVVAVADGFVVRAADGAVVQDLDGDGYEQTGWNVLYMHTFSQDRAAERTYVYAGDRIGHPSCEGGVANAAHLHVARKHNGEWIPADGGLPFVLGGWTSSGNGTEYDGFLRRGSAILEATEGASELNLITR